MEKDLNPKQAVQILLSYHLLAGHDCIVSDDAICSYAQEEQAIPDWMRPERQSHSNSAQKSIKSSAPLPAFKPETATPLHKKLSYDTQHDSILDARQRAAAAGNLDALREALESFDGCGLKKTARQLVFSDGNPQAKVMMVGEAPGRDEDAQGKPFVGRAGQLLNAMLAAIGLTRDHVYIANSIPWRPPGNRTPTAEETALCLPFIERQIELVDPAILVFLGGTSAKTLLRTTTGITRLRGRWMDYSINDVKLVTLAMLHPASLLRNPINKRHAWNDMLMLKHKMAELGIIPSS
jgi:uracil-DNA glycosylase family 4